MQRLGCIIVHTCVSSLLIFSGIGQVLSSCNVFHSKMYKNLVAIHVPAL